MKLQFRLFAIYIIFLSFYTSNSRAQEADSSKVVKKFITYREVSKGGAGGKIIKVTNLNPSGEGSLKHALESSGARIVVFEVGGIIDLNKVSLRINKPFLTIAGQTAPFPGITLVRGGVNIGTHDVIIQHIRVRPGDASESSGSGFEPDGLSITGKNAYNVIVDHCSFSWAVDENLSASGGRQGYDSTSRKITFSNNIIAEGLSKSSHAKGSHSMGTLIHDFVKDVVIIGNFYSCNYWRNPFFKGFSEGVVVNNLIYNPGRAAIHMSWSKTELSHLKIPPKNALVSVVGNVLYLGPDSFKGMSLVTGKGDIYLKDNLAYDQDGKNLKQFSGDIQLLKDLPSWPENFIALPSKDVRASVLKNAGARPKERDNVDTRIIDDFSLSRGKVINSQEEVGGYPVHKTSFRKLDIPQDGIEDWLQQFSLSIE